MNFTDAQMDNIIVAAMEASHQAKTEVDPDNVLDFEVDAPEEYQNLSLEERTILRAGFRAAIEKAWQTTTPAPGAIIPNEKIGVQTVRSLARAGFSTYADFHGKSVADLLDVRNVGPVKILHIVRMAHENGACFVDENEAKEWPWVQLAAYRMGIDLDELLDNSLSSGGQ